MQNIKGKPLKRSESHHNKYALEEIKNSLSPFEKENILKSNNKIKNIDMCQVKLYLSCELPFNSSEMTNNRHLNAYTNCTSNIARQKLNVNIDELEKHESRLLLLHLSRSHKVSMPEPFFATDIPNLDHVNNLNTLIENGQNPICKLSNVTHEDNLDNYIQTFHKYLDSLPQYNKFQDILDSLDYKPKNLPSSNSQQNLDQKLSLKNFTQSFVEKSLDYSNLNKQFHKLDNHINKSTESEKLSKCRISHNFSQDNDIICSNQQFYYKSQPVIKNYSPNAYKFYMEQHIENIFQNYRARQERKDQLEREMSKIGLSEEAQNQMRKILSRKESNYMRLKRSKIKRGMFVKIKTIGIGAFGEVALVYKKDDPVMNPATSLFPSSSSIASFRESCSSDINLSSTLHPLKKCDYLPGTDSQLENTIKLTTMNKAYADAEYNALASEDTIRAYRNGNFFSSPSTGSSIIRDSLVTTSITDDELSEITNPFIHENKAAIRMPSFRSSQITTNVVRDATFIDGSKVIPTFTSPNYSITNTATSSSSSPSQRSSLSSMYGTTNSNLFGSKSAVGFGFNGSSSQTQLYAMKTLRKSDVFKRNQAGHVKAERDILAEADTEWVVKLYYSFQDEQNLYFVMDYVPGGDMMSLLIKFGIFPERPLAIFYAAELVLAIDSVHQLGFIHRDIKPDNVLIDRDGHIKLTDFGLCTGFRWTHDSRNYEKPASVTQPNLVKLQTNNSIANDPHSTKHEFSKAYELYDRIAREIGPSFTLQKPYKVKGAEKDYYLNHDINSANGTQKINKSRRRLAYSLVGTPNYIAPEILLRQAYDKSCDWWSLGVILYEMLIGRPPFLANTPAETQIKVINWPQSLRIPSRPVISASARHLIRQLCRDQHTRLNSVNAIKTHPFFSGLDFDNLRKAPSPYVPPLSHAFDTSNFDDFDDIQSSSSLNGGHELPDFKIDEVQSPNSPAVIYESMCKINSSHLANDCSKETDKSHTNNANKLQGNVDFQNSTTNPFDVWKKLSNNSGSKQPNCFESQINGTTMSHKFDKDSTKIPQDVLPDQAFYEFTFRRFFDGDSNVPTSSGSIE